MFWMRFYDLLGVHYRIGSKGVNSTTDYFYDAKVIHFAEMQMWKNYIMMRG